MSGATIESRTRNGKMPTNYPLLCSICREDTHQTYQHVDPPDWDLNLPALTLIVIGGLGLLAAIIVATMSR